MIDVRVHDGAGPTVIYLPGIHGDWGLIGAFRRELGPRVRFVEFAYSKGDISMDRLAELVHAVDKISSRTTSTGTAA